MPDMDATPENFVRVSVGGSEIWRAFLRRKSAQAPFSEPAFIHYLSPVYAHRFAPDRIAIKFHHDLAAKSHQDTAKQLRA
jgi:hypothetical protein